MVHGRLRSMSEATHRFIRSAPERGMTEYEAFRIDLRANALERLRISSMLPCLPDNDLLDDRLRVLNGEPSQLMCRLNAQSSS